MNMRIICYNPYNDYITHDFKRRTRRNTENLQRIRNKMVLYCKAIQRDQKPYFSKGLYTKKLKKLHKKVGQKTLLLYMYS